MIDIEKIKGRISEIKSNIEKAKKYAGLPYECLLRDLAEDFWSVLKKEWIDTGPTEQTS